VVGKLLKNDFNFSSLSSRLVSENLLLLFSLVLAELIEVSKIDNLDLICRDKFSSQSFSLIHCLFSWSQWWILPTVHFAL